MIDESIFREFIENRQQLGRPMTALAVRKLRSKLQDCEQEGYCPNLMLEEAIICGWLSPFPKPHHRKNQPKQMGFIEKHTDRSWADGLDVKRIK